MGVDYLPTGHPFFPAYFSVFSDYAEAKKFEVIGNIYENPELLNTP